MPSLRKAALKVGATVKPDGFPEGVIATEEKCTLESFIDGKRKKRWLCWTVRTQAPRPLHKYYIVDWGADGLVVFKKSKRPFAPKGAKLWVERSGLEEMENLGAPNAEPYIYSMLVFILDPKAKTPQKFYAIERLRDDRVFRYEGVKLACATPRQKAPAC